MKKISHSLLIQFTIQQQQVSNAFKSEITFKKTIKYFALNPQPAFTETQQLNQQINVQQVYKLQVLKNIKLLKDLVGILMKQSKFNKDSDDNSNSSQIKSQLPPSEFAQLIPSKYRSSNLIQVISDGAEFLTSEQNVVQRLISSECYTKGKHILAFTIAELYPKDNMNDVYLAAGIIQEGFKDASLYSNDFDVSTMLYKNNDEGCQQIMQSSNMDQCGYRTTVKSGAQFYCLLEATKDLFEIQDANRKTLARKNKNFSILGRSWRFIVVMNGKFKIIVKT
eukprot:TRINITY_DN4570_c0_g1_i1.p1 TRINITY_DN4570_c0_g1~~TRINITY_DN4570_c0_g1_i1.p1  ORF type:complete len:280 (-),score=42.81 TRINITY_DN4570_c0_g1_i1:420-1259(-)